MSKALRFQVVHTESYARLRTVEDIFAGRECTREQFFAARACGWSGSDGSSMSPDTIYLVRIGGTTVDYRPEWPTWQHDLDYWTIRRQLAVGEITASEAEQARERADEQLLIRLMRKVSRDAWFFVRAFARSRAAKYFEGVRSGGASSAQPRANEWYPKRAA